MTAAGVRATGADHAKRTEWKGGKWFPRQRRLAILGQVEVPGRAPEADVALARVERVAVDDVEAALQRQPLTQDVTQCRPR